MTSDELQSVLHVREVARALKLSRATIYRRIADGQLPVVKVGKAMRVPTSAIIELLGPDHPGNDTENTHD